MNEALFKRRIVFWLVSGFLASSGLIGQNLILDLSGVSTSFITAVKPGLIRQALVQSHHPVITWNPLRRTAVGLRYTFSMTPESEALPRSMQTWSGEVSQLLTTNLGVSGQLAWAQDGADVAVMQGAGLVLRPGDTWYIGIQLSALKGAQQFHNQTMDVRLAVDLPRLPGQTTIGFGQNTATYRFNTGVLATAPSSLETQQNYLFGSWRWGTREIEMVPTLIVGSNLILFSLELLKLSP